MCIPAAALEAFQMAPPTTIFLLSLRSGAVGLNLTARATTQYHPRNHSLLTARTHSLASSFMRFRARPPCALPSLMRL